MKQARHVLLSRSVVVCAAIAVAMPMTASGGPPAKSPAGPPAGHTRALPGQRTTTPPVIDGVVEEAAWADAPIAQKFWVSEWQRAPTEKTEVKTLYDDRALYIAFICYDSKPKAIVANQITRNAGAGLDDRVTVEIDPYHNHRLLSQFSVNARGTQLESIAGGRAGKIGWKGDWTGAARRTAFGWTAEMAIPFGLLEFDRRTDVFGINFVRYLSRTQEWSHWANLTPQWLAEESGHLTGLRLLAPATASRLSVMQYATAGFNAANGAGEVRDRLASTGLDIRYDWRGNLSTVLSVNPDFSQADQDVLGLGFAYNEKFRSDHRPFFQDGAGYLADRTVFHSGRIGDFDVGVKSFGRVGPYQLGALAVTNVGDGRRDYVGRVVRELGPVFSAGITVVGTDRPAFSNQVVKVEAGGRLGRHLRFGADLASSWAQGVIGNGQRITGSIGYQTANWSVGGWLDRTDVTYLPANGFVAGDVLGTRGGGGHAAYRRSFARWLRRADFSLSLATRQTLTGLPQSESLSLYGSAETRSNIQVSAGVTAGPYRPRGVHPGEWLGAVNEDRLYTSSVYRYTPSGRYGYGVTYSWGFLAGADYRNLSPSFFVSPNPHVSLAYSYERADYYGLQHQNVLSGTWQVTPEQAISARWVQVDGGYYRVVYRRVVRRGIDLLAVYNNDPYTADSLNVKLAWTLLPLHLK